MRTLRLLARARLAALALLLALIAAPALSLAQDSGATGDKPPEKAGDKAGDKAAADKPPAAQYGEGFTPVTANEKEHVPGGTLLVIAYAVAWLGIFGYVAVIWRRQGHVETELGDLARKLDDHQRKKKS
jgi:CcmD family protein